MPQSIRPVQRSSACRRHQERPGWRPVPVHPPDVSVLHKHVPQRIAAIGERRGQRQQRRAVPRNQRGALLAGLHWVHCMGGAARQVGEQAKNQLACPSHLRLSWPAPAACRLAASRTAASQTASPHIITEFNMPLAIVTMRYQGRWGRRCWRRYTSRCCGAKPRCRYASCAERRVGAGRGQAGPAGCIVANGRLCVEASPHTRGLQLRAPVRATQRPNKTTSPTQPGRAAPLASPGWPGRPPPPLRTAAAAGHTARCLFRCALRSPPLPPPAGPCLVPPRRCRSPGSAAAPRMSAASPPPGGAAPCRLRPARRGAGLPGSRRPSRRGRQAAEASSITCCPTLQWGGTRHTCCDGEDKCGAQIGSRPAQGTIH